MSWALTYCSIVCTLVLVKWFLQLTLRTIARRIDMHESKDFDAMVARHRAERARKTGLR